MQLNIENRVALVTGASQGIGRAIALQLAREKAKVVITSNDAERLNNVAAEIQDLGGEAFAIAGDATQKTDIENIVKQAVEQFGTIDILVNNVGLTGRLKPVTEVPDEEWLYLFELNVMSGVRFTQAVLPYLQAKKWGRIIFISSERGIEPRTHFAPYAMTKLALLSLTKSFANELGAWGITVNSVVPGVIPTPAFDHDAKIAGLSREAHAAQFCQSVLEPGKGRPEDVASMVCYLCSEAAHWITGSAMRVDGGAVSNVQA